MAHMKTGPIVVEVEAEVDATAIGKVVRVDTLVGQGRVGMQTTIDQEKKETEVMVVDATMIMEAGRDTTMIRATTTRGNGDISRYLTGMVCWVGSTPIFTSSIHLAYCRVRFLHRLPHPNSQQLAAQASPRANLFEHTLDLQLLLIITLLG